MSVWTMSIPSARHVSLFWNGEVHSIPFHSMREALLTLLLWLHVDRQYVAVLSILLSPQPDRATNYEIIVVAAVVVRTVAEQGDVGRS